MGDFSWQEYRDRVRRELVPPRTEPDPEVRGKVQPLSAQLTALRPRIAPDVADVRLSTDLDGLIDAFQKVRDGLPVQQQASPGPARSSDPDWRYAQWWYAQALAARARSAAVQADPQAAVAWYGKAVAAWRELGDNREVDDCTLRAALARFAGNGDADEAIESLLERADEAAKPGRPVTQARLLTQAADILLAAGDTYGARHRAEEAGAILSNLAFTDPTKDVEAAFAAWVATQHGEEIAPPGASASQFLLTTVALAWQKVIQVRAALIDADEDAANKLIAVLEQVRLLIQQIGEQTRQVRAEIAQGVQVQ
jgi:tetratricopeptide (TPR) repeat protein